jgi:hypothetical protein
VTNQQNGCIGESHDKPLMLVFDIQCNKLFIQRHAIYRSPPDCAALHPGYDLSPSVFFINATDSSIRGVLFRLENIAW